MFKYLLSFFSIIFLLSCVNTECIKTPNLLSDRDDILLPTQSFVKVEQDVLLLNKKDPTNLAIIAGYNGSGSIIKKTETQTFILTAGHLCEHHGEDKEQKNNTSYFLIQKFTVYDLDMNIFEADVFKIDNKLDTCILVINQNINDPVLSISKNKPVLGDRIYLLSAPRGMMGKQMLPIFEGRYDGDGIGKTEKDVSIFSITVAPGSSGSPILDRDGNLIGVLTGQSTEKGLENSIAIGTSYQDTFALVLGL